MFTARLMDTSAVFVVPEEPHGLCYRLFNVPTLTGDSDGCRISAVMDLKGIRKKDIVLFFEQTRGQRQTGRNDLPGKGEKVASGW